MTQPKHAILVRTETSLEGTASQLFVKSGGQYTRFCYALELPWFNNLQSLSCIPTGMYLCKMTYSPKYRRQMYVLNQVPSRSGIRIHSANFAGSLVHQFKCELLGCISFGSRLFGGPRTNSQLMLQNSRVTTRKVEEFFEGKPFLLSIIGEFECLES